MDCVDRRTRAPLVLLCFIEEGETCRSDSRLNDLLYQLIVFPVHFIMITSHPLVHLSNCMITFLPILRPDLQIHLINRVESCCWLKEIVLFLKSIRVNLVFIFDGYWFRYNFGRFNSSTSNRHLSLREIG